MPFEHLSKALPAWRSNKSKQSLSLGNQQKCAQVNQLNAAQVNQLNAAQVNQLNAAQVNQLKAAQVNQLKAAQVNQLKAAQVNQLNAAQVNQLKAAQVNQLNAAQVNQLNAATVSSRSLGVEFLNQIQTVHFFIVIQTSDTEVTKGPSIYDVHTEGVQAQMDACGRGGGGQLWTSTQNIKIRHHNIT